MTTDRPVTDPAAYTEGGVVPMTTPALVEFFINTRAERLELDRQAKEVKEQEDAAKAELLRRMSESGQHALASERMTVVLNRKEKPVPTDWAKLYAFILDTGAVELLQRRVAEGAIKERWEAGVEIPGVGVFPVDDLTIRKI